MPSAYIHTLRFIKNEAFTPLHVFSVKTSHRYRERKRSKKEREYYGTLSFIHLLPDKPFYDVPLSECADGASLRIFMKTGTSAS